MIAGLAGCDSARTLTAPTPLPQAAPQPNPTPNPSQIQLTGYVADSAFRSLAGARVEIVAGPETGMSTTTDATGHFSMTGLFDDTNQVRATKEGYVDSTGSLYPCGNCGNGNSRRWISLYLGVTEPPVNMAGDFTLTFMADDACTGLPDELRTRTYAATIRPGGVPQSPAGTQFDVTLSGAAFETDWHQFLIGVAGNVVTFAFWGEPLWIVEHLAPRTTLGYGGRAEVSVGPSVSTISTTFEGVIDYCVLKADTKQFWQCGTAQAEAHVACESKNHRLILTRR